MRETVTSSVCVCVCPAAGAAASEGSSSGVQWDEVSGLPESEHAGGDDLGVRLFILIFITHMKFGSVRMRSDSAVFQDEEAEGGDGGGGQRAGGEQPLLREVLLG